MQININYEKNYLLSELINRSFRKQYMYTSKRETFRETIDIRIERGSIEQSLDKHREDDASDV